MTGATPASRPRPQRAGTDQGTSGDRDLWPREFGRDGVSGLVSADRAIRARAVSKPTPADELAAAAVVDDLLARVDGRRRPTPAARPNPQRPQRP